MAETYFTKLPKILYRNTLTRDLSERVKITAPTRRLTTAFYPFELSNGVRPDTVAHSYYKDPTMDWMIFLTNGITDPYYDWYLYTEEFDNYIIKKYGSVEEAQENISHYQTNWATDPINMSVAGFNSALPQVQKYYVPIFGAKAKIMSYTRRKEDWVANTNKIVRIELDNASEFVENEVVELADNHGRGQVTYVTDTAIDLWHVSGDVGGYASSLVPIVSVIGVVATGETSGTSGTISARDEISTVLAAEEYPFWEPVSFYDKETNLNESKRYVYLIDGNLAFKVSEEIRKSLLKKV